MLKTLFIFIVSLSFLCSINAKSTKQMSPDWKKELIEEAKAARQNAYAPYSKYLVGAAIRTDDGKLYRGLNVENISYGLTICAERCAVFSAVSDNNKNIKAIAIVTKDGSAPCGACRQVLYEFNPEMLVITSSEDGSIIKEYKLNQLLPEAFGPEDL